MVLGRKNFLFAGSDAGGEILAGAMTVIETAKLSGLNPEAYLADILGGIRTHDPRRLDELLPWTWKASHEAAPKTAWRRVLSGRLRLKCSSGKAVAESLEEAGDRLLTCRRTFSGPQKCPRHSARPCVKGTSIDGEPPRERRQ